jgi:hypothetical protein
VVIRTVTASHDTDQQYYLLANAGWWLLAGSPYFTKPQIELDYGQVDLHGGQAQLQSHGLVLLLI